MRVMSGLFLSTMAPVSCSGALVDTRIGAVQLTDEENACIDSYSSMYESVERRADPLPVLPKRIEHLDHAEAPTILNEIAAQWEVGDWENEPGEERSERTLSACRRPKRSNRHGAKPHVTKSRRAVLLNGEAPRSSSTERMSVLVKPRCSGYWLSRRRAHNALGVSRLCDGSRLAPTPSRHVPGDENAQNSRQQAEQQCLVE